MRGERQNQEHQERHTECVVCQMTLYRSKIIELEDHVRWLEGLLESARTVNRMWEETARYAIRKLGGGDDDTQQVAAYDSAGAPGPQ